MAEFQDWTDGDFSPLPTSSQWSTIVACRLERVNSATKFQVMTLEATNVGWVAVVVSGHVHSARICCWLPSIACSHLLSVSSTVQVIMNLSTENIS